MSRELGRRDGPPRIAIVDDSKLIYSDDYRYGWVAGFKALGCEVTVHDIAPLRQFGRTRRGPYSTASLPAVPKELVRRVVAGKPDLMFAHHGRGASVPEFIDAVKRQGIRTACYLCDEPYEAGETLKYSPRFGTIFTMDWCTLEAHKAARDGRSGVFYLPPGVDTNHFKMKPYFDKTGVLIRDVPAFFLGNATLVPRPTWLKPVERAVDGAQVRYWKGTGKGHKDWLPFSSHPDWYSRCVVALNVHRNPAIDETCFKRRVKGRSRHTPIPKGLKLCEYLPPEWGTGFWNDGNLPASHINPRFMEMAACGTLVVSDDHRSELARMFPFAPRADSPERFLELVDYYIQNPEEAEVIGRECSILVSKRHSYAHRAAEVLIRLGLLESHTAELSSLLGAPEDWLTPQDLNVLKARSSSEATGPSERWSPQSGMSLIKGSGSPSEMRSLDVPPVW